MAVKPPPTLLTLGSLAWNTLLIPSKDDPTEFRRQADWVGAPLLRHMIAEALVELNAHPNRSPEKTQALIERERKRILRDVLVAPADTTLKTLKTASVNITTVLSQVSKTSNPRDSNSVLRVATHYSSASGDPTGLKEGLRDYMNAAVGCNNSPDVLVLFDFDSAYRAAVASSLQELTPATGTRITIVGFAGDLHTESLHCLTPETTGGPERTIAVVRAEALRKSGLVVVESGPIERTVRDLVPYFDHEPLKSIAERARRIIVLFEEVGAIYTHLDAGQGWIHLSSKSDSIAHDNAQRFGRSPGRMAITLAAIARQIYGALAGGVVPDLSHGVRLSLAAFNRYFTEGYDREQPRKTVLSSLSYPVREQLKELVAEGARKKIGNEYAMASLKFSMTREVLESWTRLDDVIPAGPEQRSRLQRMIVLKGPEFAFRNTTTPPAGPWHPQARTLCPYMQVGDLKTFDEEEIAGFTSLTKLFRKYLQTPSWKSPLSIAVFGPPGTGKSFAVRELMKSVNPAAERELTFNLSQLGSAEALNDAFRDVQHRVLSSPEVPLVFFDEFDANFDGRLGWLKYFLAPMQDGVFRGKATDYRIGRAFFVFAGGTSPTFDKFQNQMRLEDAREDDPEPSFSQDAKVAKLPDFVSRLQGFLDIQSINPPEHGEPDPPKKQLQRQVKRALLLRSLLLTYAKPIIRNEGADQVPNIDDKLVDAFLNAARYEHGLRSMESIVRMSKWIDGRFIPASLPARSLLSMHVKGLKIQGIGGETTLA